MKILIAEDSQFMRGVLKDILTEANHEVIEAVNGQETLEKIKSEKPELVLLDIIMPIMDGIEVLKKVGSNTKVIVISAIGQNKMVDEAKALGALDYIIKPFAKEDVISAINKEHK